MFDISKKIFAVLILVFMSACSSRNQNNVPNVVAETSVMTTQVDGSDDIDAYEDDFMDYEDDEEEKASSNDNQFTNMPVYDSKLLYKQLEKQVKKVEIKRIIVKPVFNTDRDPVDLSLEEVQDVVDNISSEDEFEDGMEYENKSVMVLMDNYKNILKASYSCCVSNIVDELKRTDVPHDSILRYLSLDAEEYSLQNMCLVVNNSDVKDVYNSNFLTSVVSKVRNDCICNNADFIRKNLNNFYKLYNEKPELYDEVLVYRFKDKMGRIVEQNINETVLNITNVLNNCVK
ncbi:hypothetical protein HDR59_04710 [bacterium]|nr:hypothetical protein [bacterium]